MRIAIVGHEAAKFTATTEAQARRVIRSYIDYFARQTMSLPTVVSGACPLGGVDIFAVEEARIMGARVREYPPKTNSWANGYKQRNLQIAGDCDVAVCIVVKELPPGYTGMRFSHCYHCNKLRQPHVKSGGCWTVMQAQKRGVSGYWHILP